MDQEMQRVRIEAAEAYLVGVREDSQAVRRMQTELQEQRALVSGLTGIDYSRPLVASSAYGDRIPDSVAELLEMERAYDEGLAALERRRADARARLDEMGGREADILRLYYVSALDWKCVAKALNYAISTCKNLRPDALFCFYDYLPHWAKLPEQPAV